MNHQLTEQPYQCPYCGERIDAFVDISQGSHQTIEDCRVCCRPIELNISVDEVEQTITLTAQTDAD
ncbi:MAG TPA: CPXCG motif-containing cysteine-rich protein [Cycloclasticus sp.]|jgi:5-methylcytosine-specific restriction endonuclease McrA|nr:CPXCG motif-containing cysteine-rich protein [Cycloclasticus sp.]HIL91828.1 CPXCG motif-containing cysteine-rich protein [Cycloclasticus sp.]